MISTTAKPKVNSNGRAARGVAMFAVDEIRVGRRHRKDLGDVRELADSIEKVGLLHPIVVLGDKRLVVGQRRLEAFKLLGRDKIPANVAANVEEAYLLAAERDENTCRKAFTPSEIGSLTLEITKRERPAAAARMKASAQKAGKKSGAIRASNGGANCPSVKRDESKRATAIAAQAAGVSRHTAERAAAVVASGDKKLIAQMDRTGKVNSAHRSLLNRKKAAELEKKAAAAVAARPNGDPVWTIIDQDVLVGLQSARNHYQPPRLIFADPPYNIGVDYGEGAAADQLDDDEYLDWARTWLGLCADLLLPDGSLWVLIGDEYAAEYAVALKGLGLTIRSWIKWYESFGVNCHNNFNRCSRHLFYCVRDPKRFVFHAHVVNRPSDRQQKYADKRAAAAGKIWDNVWGINPVIPRLTGTCRERLPGFPTQLPLALVEPIVLCASEPGDTVLDPFSGSATTGVAAVRNGRKFIGIEKSELFAVRARQRLECANDL